MLNGGDLDVNSVEVYSNSVRDALKHTMLSQEVVFRTQVYELHRLYRVQKNLVNDFELRVFGERDLLSWNSESTSLAPPRNQINYIPTKGGTPSASSMGEFTKDCTQNFLHNLRNGLPEIRQAPFDLQLPADKFIGTYVDNCDSERKDHFANLLKDSRKSEHVHSNANDQEDAKLSLSFINNMRRNGVGSKKKARYIPHDVIDLESPNGCFSNNYCNSSFSLSFAPPHAFSRDENEVEHSHQSLPWLLQTAKDNLNHGMTRSQLPPEFDLSCQKLIESTSEFSGEEHLLASHRALDLDLNIAQVDSFSNISTDSVVLNPLRTSSTSVTATSQHVNLKIPMESPLAPKWKDSNEKNHVTEMSNRFQQDDSLHSHLDDGNNIERGNCSNNSNSGQLNGVGRVIGIDLERVPESPLDVGEKIYCTENVPRNESEGSPLKALDHVSCERAQMDAAGADVDVGNAAREKLCAKLTGSLEFEITADNQSGIECGDSNFSSSNEVQKGRLGSQIENSSIERDQRSSESTVSNNLLPTDKEEQAEVDELVQRAANSLVCLSLDSRAFNQNEWENVNATILQNEVDVDKTQYSIDSYEEMVLNLEESGPEDLTASSKKFEFSEPGKECGYKLKRGSRMKDFQKDILPSLSALSCVEICEDISIMEGVIRSREYKKMRSMMGGVGDLCKPSRSRRSRVNYSRRYYG